MTDDPEREYGDDDADDGSDADTPPGAPGDSDSALGDTDQHSDSDA